jgi:hypothetical protein
MALPRVDQPVYEVKLLSQDAPVKFIPFTVKEQKLMMMAVEAKDIDNTIKTIKQIVTNCVLDPINAEELPLADLETLFLNLRARSMGEVLNLFFKCTNKVVDTDPMKGMSLGGVPNYKDCGMILEVVVNLLEVEQINKDTQKKIMFSDDIGVLMKYPTIDMVDKLMKANDAQVTFTVIASCIDQIFDVDSVHKASDATTEELVDWVEKLPTKAYEKMEEFVDKVPKSRFETKKKCTKCGYEHDFVLEGLSDFFT